MPSTKPQTTHLKHYQPPIFLVTDIEIEVDIQDTWTVVTSKVKGYRNPKSIVPNEPLILNGEGQTLLEVKLHGRVLKEDEYQITDEKLTIANVVDEFCLEITSKNYPKNNQSLEGLYLSEGMYWVIIGAVILFFRSIQKIVLAAPPHENSLSDE
mgnify:CR=1 FL=1